jgi:uncharacterized membrane protein YphA (DoxX/SURF4 family)
MKYLTWLLAMLFIAGGAPKVLGLGSTTTEFARFGYSAGFCVLIGVVEIAGGVALLVRSVALYGALLLLAIMAGATWTLVKVGDAPVPPLVVGSLLAIVIVAQLRSTTR